MRLLGLILVGTLAVPGAARAQTPAAPFQDQMRAAARLELAGQRAGAGIPFALHADLTADREFTSRAPGATMMIIGGAGILAGALIGGSGGALLILGGVGLGAYGFYLYTR